MQSVFTDTRQTLVESVADYFTVSKWRAEFKRGKSGDYVSPSTSVNEEIVKKFCNLFWVINGWQLVSLLSVFYW